MKNYKFQIGMLLVVLLLASCQEKEELGGAAKGSVSLNASIENGGTRTSVDEEGHVSWVETDAIGVFGKQTKNAKFQSTGAGTSIKFVGEMSAQDEPSLAYYPYDESASLDGNTLHFTLPSEYTYTGESNAPMLGVKQEDDSFTFKHLCGLLKVTIEDMPESATKFVITSNGNSPLPISGVATVEDVMMDNAVLELQSLPDAYCVTYNFSPTVFSSDKVFYIPLPRGTYERLVVSLMGNEDEIIFERSVSNLKVERAAMIEMPVLGCEDGISYTLADDVFPIIKSDEKYITSVDGNKIAYKSNIPADRRPQAGQILLFSDVTEMFPTGFWGRVKNISETNDGFVIETETVTIEETFKNLNVNKNIKIYKGNNDIEVVLESEHSIGSRSSTVIEEIITIPLNGNFKTENWFANFQGNISLLMQLGFNIKIENHSISVFIIKPQIGLNTHIDDFSFGLYKELSNDLGFSNSIPIIQPVRRILSAMSIGPLVIVPELIGGLFASASGEVEITLPFKFDLGAELELNLLTGGFSVPKPTGGIDFSDVFTDKFNVKLKGGVGVGPGAGLGFIFYGLVPVEFIYSPQYAFSGELELYFNSPYNALKNSKTKFGNILNLEASIGSVFSQQLKKSISFSSGDAYMGIEKCFLPTISNMKLNASEVLNRAEQNEMISYNIDNESWLSHKHSLMILKDGKLIKTLSDNRFDNFVNDSQGVLYYELSEEGLAYGEKYKAKALITVPYFTGDRVYEADSIEFIYPENIKVTTGDVVDFSYNSASFGTNFISGINLNSEFKYGILCSWDNVPTVDNSVKVENNEIEDGSFTAFTTNLNPNIRYYYRAYVYKNNEYYYGETKEFIAKSLNIETKDFSNLTNNNVTLFGVVEGMKDITRCEYGIIYSTDVAPTASNGTMIYSDNIQEDGNYSVDVASLTENTTYYYRAFVIDGGNYVYGDVKSFTTLSDEMSNMSDRDILIAFYNANGGVNWSSQKNWCTDAPLDDWTGVVTDEEGFVIQFSIPIVNKRNVTGDANLSGLSRLETLSLEGAQITSLDVSGCSNLTHLSCWNCEKLASVDLNGCNKLEYVNFLSCKLPTLDVSHCPDLKELNCSENEVLASLNINGCGKLEYVDVSNNKISNALDFSGNVNLTRLFCDGNELPSLDVKGCTNLNELMCISNQLSSLDISDCTELTLLSCGGNQLSALDLSANLKLQNFSCGGNKLSSLDISNLKSLKGLTCSDNQLTELNILNNTAITSLYCTDNQITSLDLRNLSELKILECSNNKLTKLQISGLAKLYYMDCENNLLTDLDFAGCTGMQYVECNDNKLTTIDVSQCSELLELNCHNNVLTSLDVTANTLLERLNCSNNSIASLNLANNKNVIDLRVGYNLLEAIDVSNMLDLKYFYTYANESLKQIYISTSFVFNNNSNDHYLWGNRSYDYTEDAHLEYYQYPEFIRK